MIEFLLVFLSVVVSSHLFLSSPWWLFSGQPLLFSLQYVSLFDFCLWCLFDLFVSADLLFCCLCLFMLYMIVLQSRG